MLTAKRATRGLRMTSLIGEIYLPYRSCRRTLMLPFTIDAFVLVPITTTLTSSPDNANTDCVGDAAEQDETFWGDGIWGESDDESFSEVEVEPDQFDSDFNDTEDEGGNSEDDEKAVKKTSETEVTAQLSNQIYLFRLLIE